MFDEEYNSLFENDDNLGVNTFRDDFNYIFEQNKVKVLLIKSTDGDNTYQQGDFLGIKTKTFDNKKKIIYVNIFSDNPEDKKLGESGYGGLGQVTYTGYARWDSEIENKDRIEFLGGYSYNIKKGDRFKIQLKDNGMYKGQYCYINFILTKVE